jgi:hypothetical protein
MKHTSRGSFQTLAVDNMKKLTPVLLLLIGVGIGFGSGFGIGWIGASYRSSQYFKKLRQTWSPEFQEFVSKSTEYGIILADNLTEKQILKLAKLGDRVITDQNSKIYGQAKQSLLMKKLIKNGKIDDALSYSESCLERFVEQYDRGDFEDDINEELAGKLADHIKSANQSTHSITDSAGSE